MPLLQSFSVIPYLLAFVLFYLHFVRKGFGRRMSFLIAAACWGFAVTLSTESLSPFHLITRNWLLFFWLLLCLIAVLLLRFDWTNSTPPDPSREQTLEPLSTVDRVLVAGISLILAITAFNAVLAPPNTDDGMEYHLPRVVVWASNHSVQFFPVFDFAQILHTPWAEYAALHLHVLQGSDRLFNLIEWFSFLGCILAVSLIAQKVGASRRGQLLAATLCATLPELILESTGPNNTAVAAFWMAAAVAFLLQGGSSPAPLYVALSGIAIGLSVLTKGTSVVLLPGLLLAVLIILKPKLNWQTVARISALAGLAVLLNAPKFVENYRFDKQLMGLPYAEAGVRLSFRNESHTPKDVVSGVVRNAALHLSVPSNQVNTLTQNLVRSLLKKMGIDPDDPRTTWRDKFIVPSFTTREYFAGFPGQFALFLIFLPWALIRWRAVSHAALLLLFGAIFSFVLFSASIKWQPSSARFHLPLFVVITAALGAIIPTLLGRKIVVLVAVLALIGSLPFVLDNGLRSLTPADRTSVFRNSRDAMYFLDNYQQDNWTVFEETAEEVRRSGCQEIGIDAQLQTYVYPIIPLIRNRVPDAQFQYVGVENPTKQFAATLKRPTPCTVVCLGCMRTAKKWEQYKSFGNRASIFGGDNVVFWRGGGEANEMGVESTDTPFDPIQLSDRADAHLRNLLTRPEFSMLGDHHELDSPFQDARGAMLRGKRDAAYELRMRATHIWEGSEPLRVRARAGAASAEDLHVLQTLDEAFEELSILLKRRYDAFQLASDSVPAQRPDRR